MQALIEYVQMHLAGIDVLYFVGATSAAEYLVPPLPADTVVVASALIALRGDISFFYVYAAVVLGGVLGSAVQYGLGRFLSDGKGGFRGQAMMSRLLGSSATDGFIQIFHRHGYTVIAVNRFLPGVRAAVFFMSGALELGLIRILLLGLLSNLVWSALLLGLALTIGDNLEKIQAFLSVYRYSAGGILIAFVGVFAYRNWKRWRKQ